MLARKLSTSELELTYTAKAFDGDGAGTSGWTLSTIRSFEMLEYVKSITVEERLHVAPSRNGNCWEKTNRGFPLLPNTPHLKVPDEAGWRHTLAGQHLGFIGDSVLRDVFVQICRALSRSIVGLSHGDMRGMHFGWARVQLSNNGSLEFVFARSVEDWANKLKRFASAFDLVIAHGGAHIDKNNISPFVRTVQLAALNYTAGSFVWMQYPAVHFPLATGEGGEFEEFTVRRNQEAYLTGNVTACAARTASQKSPITAALLAIDAQLEAVGVIVLPTFDATVQLHEAHPQCISQGSGGCKAGSNFNGFIDCRHWCSPGVALTVIERRLYAMLSPIPEPLRN